MTATRAANVTAANMVTVSLGLGFLHARTKWQPMAATIASTNASRRVEALIAAPAFLRATTVSSSA